MADLQEQFTLALRLHGAGRLAEAEGYYRQILAALPDNVNVLGNLGLVCRDQGKLAEAETYCRQAALGAPNDPQQHLNLGAVYEAGDDGVAALACYEKALALAPDHPKVLNNLGKLYHQQGRSQEGQRLLEQAVRIEPRYPLALNNLGVLYSETGDLARAGQCLERSVSLDPTNIAGLFNLAGLYNAQNDLIRAKQTLTRLVAIDPGHQAGRHMLAALSGEITAAAPPGYVEEVFDRYASRFDQHIQASLGYRVPTLLAEMLALVRPTAQFGAALDLGCGTGLSAAPFRSRCTHLTGVDLSAAMLAQAAAKKIYDQLHRQEVLAFLAGDDKTYDLVIAADVLIYLGDLAVFFAAVTKRVAPGSLLVCSIERSLTADRYSLLTSGRYGHHPQYLIEQAQQSQFSLVLSRSEIIRREASVGLEGDLFVLEKDQP